MIDSRHNHRLLTNAEPLPATILGCTNSKPRCLLVADHASRLIPKSLDNLGLSDAVLSSHLGWDIGTAALTRALSAQMSLPAVLANYSRLVVDCNRAVEDDSAFLTYSDGVRIRANAGLDAQARRKRLDEVYWPYHQCVESELVKLEEHVERAALISIHSFTPVFDGKRRRWDCGVLWDKDPRIAVPLMAALAESGLVVGDNEPYSGRSSADFTVDVHGEAKGRPHVAIEIRQDQLSNDADIEAWAVRLRGVLDPILDEQILYQSLQQAV